MNRRQILKGTGAALLMGSGLAPGMARMAFAADTVELPFANGMRNMVTYPGKRPLIGLTARPPQLETPFEVFNESIITPNDAFFVRYHLADIPTEIDPETFRVEVAGRVATPLSLSLADLKRDFETVELVAVNQCSGNSRGLFEPRIGGGQLGNGAMLISSRNGGRAGWLGFRGRA